MKKRMLYLSVYDPHVPYTGAGVRGGEFVTNLARVFDIDLVYLEGSGHPGDPDLEEKFEWRVTGTQSKRKIPFSQKDYFIFSDRLYQEAEKLISKHHFDIVLTDYGISAMYGLKLRQKYQVPFIYCSHNIEYRQYLGKAKQDKRRYLFVPRVYHIEKKGVKKCSLLVPISDADAEFYSKWKDKLLMHVVPQCFNESIYNPYYEAPNNEAKKILFFGNYNISTNRDAVYAACDQVVDQVVAHYPDVKFQFIGANPPNDIKHPNVEFLGFVEHLEEYLKGCDVMISPILAGWGMPTKIIESLACGKPIVATEAAARAVPKKYRTLHIVSVSEFADTIVKLLKENNPVDASDFELLKQEFTWSGALTKLAERIEQII
ncbi:glycosyltransferase family 4 protein [candidate division KSB1 bacterium]|nr:glycosyltransferase family 4 protein [candidate division KSB1 bacterium]